MGGIIWLASYPKSGNTWARVFLYNFFADSKEPADLNKIGNFCLGEANMLWYARQLGKDQLSQEDDEDIARVRAKVHAEMTKVHPDSVFVKTHNYLGEIFGHPIHNMNVTAGTIYILRNPLDVAISMTSHFGMSQDEAIAHLGNPAAMTGTEKTQVFQSHADWSTHVSSWTQSPNPYLHVVRYEDMKEDPKKYFGRMAKFLGLKFSQERLRRAIKNSSFERLKKLEQEKGFKEKSKKAESFFRKGEKDQWREVLSDAQIKKIISDHRQVMEKFGYVPEGY